MICLYCDDLKKIRPFECCSSCHTEEEEGYGSLCGPYHPDGKFNEVSLFVCCSAPTENITEQEWSKMMESTKSHG
jgi:hypothetical protein